MTLRSPVWVALIALGALVSATCGEGDADRFAIVFSAGGSVYEATIDGETTLLVGGSREAEMRWASAPELVGDSLYFVRDLDVWRVSSEGSAELVLNVGEWTPSPGSSNFSLGVQSISVSPDGGRVAYVLARVGGSGVAEVWVASLGRDAEPHRVYDTSAFAWVEWVDDQRLVLAESASAALVIDAASGARERVPLDLGPVPVRVIRQDDTWLVSPFVREGRIRIGSADALRPIAEGVGAALSRDGKWVAYFRDDMLRVVRADGTNDRVLVDLVALGGQDLHFAMDCSALEPCSYRPPSLNWTVLP